MRTFWSWARRNPVPTQVVSAPEIPAEQGGRGRADAGVPDPASDSFDGAVWIDTGVPHVCNPRGLGRWATVTVPPDGGLELLVNGELRTGEVVLRAEDRLEVRGRVNETPGRADVDIAEDQMTAWVTVRPGEYIRYTVADAPPANQLDLQSVEQQESQLRDLTEADVRDALRTAGVPIATSDHMIQQALHAPGTPVVAARGCPPLPGRPAGVWTCMDGDLGAVPAARPYVDLDNQGSARPFVETGQPVAQLSPGDPSVPGQTVRGEPATTDQPWQPTLVAGLGTLLSADGFTAIAAISGHPVVNIDAERVYVTVGLERQSAGDVDGGTGDVSYDGDIWVAGNIQSGRTVYAAGKAEVRGHVFQARIEAGGGISVHGGAVNALLIAGGPGLTYARALILCGELLQTIGAVASPGDGAQPCRS